MAFSLSNPLLRAASTLNKLASTTSYVVDVQELLRGEESDKEEMERRWAASAVILKVHKDSVASEHCFGECQGDRCRRGGCPLPGGSDSATLPTYIHPCYHRAVPWEPPLRRKMRSPTSADDWRRYRHVRHGSISSLRHVSISSLIGQK